MPPWQEQAHYCPLCGATLVSGERGGRARPVCPRCGFVLYHGPAAASAAIVVRDRQVLVVRRAIEPYRGYWGFPAGYQEYGETPEATAVRETAEETGIEIEITGLYGLFYTVDDPRKNANLAVFTAVPVGGTLRPGPDCDEALWCALDEVPEPVSFANNRRILAELRARFPKGPIDFGRG